MSGVLGISGHRPSYWGYKPEDFERLVHLVKGALVEECPARVITGMALGMDFAAAIASRDLGIPYVAAVPFHGQEDPWPPRMQELYRDLLKGALLVHCASPGGYSSKAFKKRNEYVVANSHRMLVLYDGSPNGGTAHTVRLAIQRGLPMRNLWGEFRGLVPKSSNKPIQEIPGEV